MRVLITLIGSTFPAEDFTQYLEKDDPCFEKAFAKSAKECKECRAPVLMDGKIHLLRDVCEARTRGADSPTQLKRLTSQEVLDRLVGGAEPPELFREVLADSDPDIAGAAARALIKQRLNYLEQKGIPVPDLPRTKELKNHV